MELTGKCIAVLPMRSGVSQRNGNPWASQEYVIEVPGQYPKRMVFNVFGEDRIKQYNIQLGYTYKVEFDIDASEYQGKWYTKIKAYSVVALTQPAVSAAAQQPATPPVQYAASVSQPQPTQPALFPPEQPAHNDSDDLPF